MKIEELYSKMEHLIIEWSNDGTKTAGTLTRQLMELVKNSDETEDGERKVDFEALCKGLSEHMNRVPYVGGDLSDLGNEVGLALGRMVPKITGEEARTFIVGFNHGISLTNGTHG